MMRHIKIHTDFDITNTGVIRNYREGSLPCKVGTYLITSKEEWMKLRRQQANWETLIQIISLRTQPMNISTIVHESSWTLEFDVESIDVFRSGADPIGLLKEDIENVPLLTGLDEHKELDVDQTDDTPNIRFETYEV
jgi:hypothetical protein